MIIGNNSNFNNQNYYVEKFNSAKDFNADIIIVNLGGNVDIKDTEKDRTNMRATAKQIPSILKLPQTGYRTATFYNKPKRESRRRFVLSFYL